MNTDLPTIEEELYRKAVNELERLLICKQDGRLTNAQFSSSIDTMFAMVSGLVEGDFLSLVTEASDEIVKDTSFINVLAYRKKGVMVITFSDKSKGKFTVGRFKTTDMKRYDAESSGEFLLKEKDVKKRLEKAGFSQIK